MNEKPVIEPVAGPLDLGEGPHWDEKSQSLYLVDISAKQILNFNPHTKVLKRAQLDKKVGFVVPVKGKSDEFVTGLGTDLAIIKWNGENSAIEEVDLRWKTNEEQRNRINDGKCDPSGRLYAGTMCEEKVDNFWLQEKCNFYSIDKSGLKTKLSKVSLSNGLAWSLDSKKFYYIDSCIYNVRAFDYDITTGNIANGQVIFDLKENNLPGLPDGMTIDKDGNLWVAVYNGARVIKVDPRSGKLLFTVELPALQTTSVAFGGKNYDELYVTSANVPVPPEEEETKNKYTHNGYLFKVTGLGVKGLPPVDFAL